MKNTEFHIPNSIFFYFPNSYWGSWRGYF